MTHPTDLNYVTTPFGKSGSWAAGYHTGIDYRAPVGTPIYATRGGVVVHSGSGGKYGSAYGNYVVIQSVYQGVLRQHLYAHLSKTKVRRGSVVRAGHLIGLAGETGNTFGSHLHYEERVFPFGYYNHYRPVLVNWFPRNKKWRETILRKISPKKRKK